MPLTLAALSAVAARQIAAAPPPLPRRDPDAALDGEAAAGEAAPPPAVAAAAGGRAGTLPTAQTLAPALMSELIGLQVAAERDLPGMFDPRRAQEARRQYGRRTVTARAA